MVYEDAVYGLAGRTLGVGATPIAESFPSSAAAAAPPLRRAARAPDEAYWRQVKAQFPLRDDIVPLNAASLCPSPRPVIDAVAGAMRDLEGDVSFQNRAAARRRRRPARANSRR